MVITEISVRLRLSIAGVLLLVLFCSCERRSTENKTDSTKNTASQAKENGKQEQISEARGFIKIWKKVAKDYNLHPDIIEIASVLMEDVLEYAGVSKLNDSTDEKLWREYESSLRNFVATYEPQFRDVESRKEPCYWLAYCVVEAALRYPVDANRRETIRTDYEKTVAELKTTLRKGIKKRIESKDYQRLEDKIEEALDKFEEVMNECIRRYQQDFLCPSFTEKVIPATCERLKKRNSILTFPKYEQPEELMVSKDRRYFYELEDFLRNAARSYLFDLFLWQIRNEIHCNDYWGWMSWHANTHHQQGIKGSLVWPAVVAMEQNKVENNVKNWKRRPLQ